MDYLNSIQSFNFVSSVTTLILTWVLCFLKPFIPDKKELEKTIKLHLSSVSEKICSSYHRLLKKSLSLNNLELLRGEDLSKEDTIKSHVRVLLKYSNIYSELKNLLKSSRKKYTMFFWYSIIPIIPVILSIVPSFTRNNLFKICIIVFIILFCFVFILNVILLQRVDQRINLLEEEGILDANK